MPPTHKPMPTDNIRLALIENHLRALHQWATAFRKRVLRLDPRNDLAESAYWGTLEMLLGKPKSEQPWRGLDSPTERLFDTPVKPPTPQIYRGVGGGSAAFDLDRAHEQLAKLRGELTAAERRNRVLDQLVRMIPFECFVQGGYGLRDVLEAQAELVRRSGIKLDQRDPRPPLDENRGVVYSSAFGACPNCGGIEDHTPNCAKREEFKLAFAEAADTGHIHGMARTASPAPKTPETAFSGYVALDGEQPRPLAAPQSHDLDPGATEGTPEKLDASTGDVARGRMVWCDACLLHHRAEEYRVANRNARPGICGHGLGFQVFCSICFDVHRTAVIRRQ